MNHEQTIAQFDKAFDMCRRLYIKKLHDYEAAWRVLRPESLTDQIFIKANRIRTLQITGETYVGEGIFPEFIGIVNYGIIGQIQLALGFADSVDITPEQAVELYDRFMGETRKLMIIKNQDYDEAWRNMRISSYTDLILMKILRTRQIEDLEGRTLVSEGIDANYKDMVNYAVFALIKLDEAGIAQ